MLQFILGIIFAMIGLPILNGFAELCLCVLELWKSSISVKVVRNNVLIAKEEEEIQQGSEVSNCIGFCAPTDDEDLYDEDDDDL